MYQIIVGDIISCSSAVKYFSNFTHLLVVLFILIIITLTGKKVLKNNKVKAVSVQKCPFHGLISIVFSISVIFTILHEATLDLVQRIIA